MLHLALLLALACAPKSGGWGGPKGSDPAALAERRAADAARLEARLEGSHLSPEEQVDGYIALGQLHLDRHWEDDAEGAAQAAADAFKGALDLDMRGAKAPEAWMGLAYAYQAQGDDRQAVQAATSLARGFPEAPQRQEAYVLIGDHYFDENNAYKALLAYQKATNVGPSAFERYARYRLSWCYYNVGEYGRAIEHMQRVVEDAEAAAAESLTEEDASARLAREGVRDLARFYVDAGELDAGRAWLEARGEEEAAANLHRMAAELYSAQGRYEEAAAHYRAVVAEAPTASDALEHQLTLIQTLRRAEDRAGYTRAVEQLHREFGPKSAWGRANPQRAGEARGALDAALREAAEAELRYAQRRPNQPDAGDALARAEGLLQLWLKELAGRPAEARVLLQLAEVYRLQHRAEDLTWALEQVIQVAPGTDEAERAAQELGYR